MGRNRQRCDLDTPDCFNCPYPECYASLDDINRQEAIKKGKRENTVYKHSVNVYNNDYD